jgi:hypothetical protein
MILLRIPFVRFKCIDISKNGLRYLGRSVFFGRFPKAVAESFQLGAQIPNFVGLRTNHKLKNSSVRHLRTSQEVNAYVSGLYKRLRHEFT